MNTLVPSWNDSKSRNKPIPKHPNLHHVYSHDNFLINTLKQSKSSNSIFSKKSINTHLASLRELKTKSAIILDIKNYKNLKAQNELFSKEYQTSKKYDKLDYKKTFEQLMFAYQNKGYKVPDLSWTHDLFKVCPLIEVNNQRLIWGFMTSKPNWDSTDHSEFYKSNDQRKSIQYLEKVNLMVDKKRFFREGVNEEYDTNAVNGYYNPGYTIKNNNKEKGVKQEDQVSNRRLVKQIKKIKKWIQEEENSLSPMQTIQTNTERKALKKFTHRQIFSYDYINNRNIITSKSKQVSYIQSINDLNEVKPIKETITIPASSLRNTIKAKTIALNNSHSKKVTEWNLRVLSGKWTERLKESNKTIHRFKPKTISLLHNKNNSPTTGFNTTRSTNYSTFNPRERKMNHENNPDFLLFAYTKAKEGDYKNATSSWRDYWEYDKDWNKKQVDEIMDNIEKCSNNSIFEDLKGLKSLMKKKKLFKKSYNIYSNNNMLNKYMNVFNNMKVKERTLKKLDKKMIKILISK